MRETWARLGKMLVWGDALEKGTATHSSILAWRISWDSVAHGVTKSQIQLSDFHFHGAAQCKLRNAQVKTVANCGVWGVPGGLPLYHRNTK